MRFSHVFLKNLNFCWNQGAFRGCHPFPRENRGFQGNQVLSSIHRCIGQPRAAQYSGVLMGGVTVGVA